MSVLSLENSPFSKYTPYLIITLLSGLLAGLITALALWYMQTIDRATLVRAGFIDELNPHASIIYFILLAVAVFLVSTIILLYLRYGYFWRATVAAIITAVLAIFITIPFILVLVSVLGDPFDGCTTDAGGTSCTGNGSPIPQLIGRLIMLLIHVVTLAQIHGLLVKKPNKPTS